MGLDQYLYATRYISGSEWRGKEEQELFEKVLDTVGARPFAIKEMPAGNIEIKVAQWRKSNQIHQWFVDNCQNGEDDCRKAYVSREQLQELIGLCKQVIGNRDLADDLLPSQEGFFFGSTEYDEYYFGDLLETVEMLESALKETPDGWDFEYQSSW